jgi:hypothetical protein
LRWLPFGGSAIAARVPDGFRYGAFTNDVREAKLRRCGYGKFGLWGGHWPDRQERQEWTRQRFGACRIDLDQWKLWIREA